MLDRNVSLLAESSEHFQRHLLAAIRDVGSSQSLHLILALDLGSLVTS